MTHTAAVTSDAGLAIYDQALRLGYPQSARRALVHALEHAPAQTWLDAGRALVLRNELDCAREVFGHAVKHHPASGELCVGLAGLHWQARRPEEAEKLLRDWLAQHPTDIGASFLLARVLFDQGRAQTAATVTRELFASGPQDVETVIRAVEMLDDFGRPQEAMTICESALAGEADDPPFARVRRHAGHPAGPVPARAHPLRIRLGPCCRSRGMEHPHRSVQFAAIHRCQPSRLRVLPSAAGAKRAERGCAHHHLVCAGQGLR